MQERIFITALAAVIACLMVVQTGSRFRTAWLESNNGERTEAELVELFHEERRTFDQLGDMIVRDQELEVRTESHSWSDACDTCPDSGGRPPGVERQPCDWPHGCSRWVDEPPTPEILAAIGGIELVRAENYLEGLERIDALMLRVEYDGSVVIWMESRGIIPSGSATMLAWVPEGVAPHSSDRALADGWCIRTE